MTKKEINKAIESRFKRMINEYKKCVAYKQELLSYSGGKNTLAYASNNIGIAFLELQLAAFKSFFQVRVGNKQKNKKQKGQ